MSKFNVGDRVLITSSSMYYCGGDDFNPKDVEGVIEDIDSTEVEGYISVDWDNDTTNTYAEEDLEPVASSTGIESVLEQYAAIKTSDDMIQEARGDAYGDMVRQIDYLVKNTLNVDREMLEILFNQREIEYMEKHHAGDEAYQKKNGSWNMSKVFDGAYKSAKSTVLGAVGAGVTLLQEDGSAKGKSALAKETKEAAPLPDVEGSAMSAVMTKASELTILYAHLSDPEEREIAREFIHASIT